MELDDQKLLRYSRHILLKEVGIEGQERICQSKVLVFGAGGLGAPALTYLAAAGCGQITVVDDDVVDLTNLPRQTIHTTQRVGTAKVSSAEAAIHALNPEVNVTPLQVRAGEQEINELVAVHDVVLDCTDNFTTRQRINAACVQHKKPLVSGSAIRWDMQVSVFDLRDESAPCYACVFDPNEPPGEAKCATLGVFSALTGVTGTLQAGEALKVILGIGSTLKGRVLMLNAFDMDWQEMRITKNPHCPVCGR